MSRQCTWWYIVRVKDFAFGLTAWASGSCHCEEVYSDGSMRTVPLWSGEVLVHPSSSLNSTPRLEMFKAAGTDGRGRACGRYRPVNDKQSC